MKAKGKLTDKGDYYLISCEFKLDETVDSSVFRNIFNWELILGETFFSEVLIDLKRKKVSYDDASHLISEIKIKKDIVKIKLVATGNKLISFLDENQKQKIKKDFFIHPRISEFKEINGKKIITKISTFDIVI